MLRSALGQMFRYMQRIDCVSTCPLGHVVARRCPDTNGVVGNSSLKTATRRDLTDGTSSSYAYLALAPAVRSIRSAGL